MARISTAWVYSGLLTVFVMTQTVLSRPSRQRDIEEIARNLKITVFLETNHLSTGTYDIAYHLTNMGDSKILDSDDWEIIFSMHNRNLLTRPEFRVHGFVIRPYKESLYKMFPIPGVFPGLNRGQAFKITVTAKGLSVFRQDIHPRFIVQSEKTTPRTIRSTDDEELRFVQLTPSGRPDEDYSKMTGIQRTVMIPDVMDMEKVPESIIIPPAKNISLSPRMPLLDLSAVEVFYVWADQSVSKVFIDYFRDVFTSIPAINASKLRLVNSEPPATADRIYIQQTGPQYGKSADYYELAVRPKIDRVRNFNLIHMSATAEEGLHNAVESLMAAVGLYEILPDMTVVDDARFGHRSLSLDLTKNFFDLTTIKKVLQLMSMYKLNKLELNLGDDFAWRYEIPDLPTINTFATKRCQGNQGKNVPDCLPPYLGAGADAKLPGSGYFSIGEFSSLLRAAASKHIEVIPKFNLLGGVLSAKRASDLYYKMLRNRDRKKAERLHLQSDLPIVPVDDLPEDVLSLEGLLDPCRDQTYTFIRTVIEFVNRAYKNAGIPLKAFHAGGDELTQFLGYFPSCKSDASISTTADALRKMMAAIQKELSPLNAVLHVNEEAIVDTATNDCLNINQAPRVDQNNLIAHFYKTFPGSPEDWNLSPDQLAYMDAEVIPPDPADTSAVPDPLKPYTGQKKGLTSWIMPYRCANKGFKIVLKPENFFALDQAYELDFDEPGNRKMRRFHVINMHRMMMYEPLNHYINMDLGKDGYTFLQYRMCKMFPCEPLTKPENILGLTATVDTSVIRTEKMLWHMLLPRLLCFAEKAWREGEHENLLKAEDPNTLIVGENLERRSAAITMEINTLMNNIAYKEAGRLDEAGFAYRVPTLGASIHLGLVMYRPPPYPLMFKADMPALEIEIRNLNDPVPEWKPLFGVDPTTGAMTGGFTFDFPQSNQRVELRALSSGGRNETLRPRRPGRPVLVTGSIDNYLPREIPVELREGTCLPIEEAWQTDIVNVTGIQWRRIMQNLGVFANEDRTFRENRQRALERTVRDHNTRNRGNAVLGMVFQGIQAAIAQGQNLTTFPQNNILRQVYMADMDLLEQRGRFVDNRFRSWQQEYLRCRAGRARPTLLSESGESRGRGRQDRIGGPPGLGGGRPDDFTRGGASGVEPESRDRGGGRGRQDQMGGLQGMRGGVTGAQAGAGAGSRGQFGGMPGSMSSGRGQSLDQGRGMMSGGAEVGQRRGQTRSRGSVAQRGRGAGR